MKKLLFLLAFMSLLPSLASAQKDVTQLLFNSNCDEGVRGWNVTFTTYDNRNGYVWAATNKSEAKNANYTGFSGKNLQIWAKNVTVGASSISQTVTGLPDGTYVFGAAIAACIQDGDHETSNVSSVEGVSLFANDETVELATDCPEGEGNYQEPIIRHNVAAIVTDGKLKVGVQTDNFTSATYAVFDNVTLFNFGDVDTNEALDQMARIDLDSTIAMVQRTAENVMNADTLTMLQELVEEAIEAKGESNCKWCESTLLISRIIALRSVKDYEGLRKSINTAQEILDNIMERYDDPADSDIADAIEALAECLERANSAYEETTLERDEIDALKAELADKQAYVKLDDIYDLMDAVEMFIYEPELLTEEYLTTLNLDPSFVHPGFAKEGTEYGKIPADYFESLKELLAQAAEDVDNVGVSVTVDEALQWLTLLKEAVANAIANVTPHPTLPLDVIVIPDKSSPSKPFYSSALSGATTSNTWLQKYRSVREGIDGESYACMRYESPQFTLPYHVDKLILTVLHTACDRSKDSKTDGPYYNISEFFLYDADGEEVPLTGEDFLCNAPDRIDGVYDNLVDHNINTLFHSSWRDAIKPEEYYHNLVITMPEDLLTFSFAIEQAWSNNRIYNMPTEILISGISNVGVELNEAINEASALCAVEGNEPGFMQGDLSDFTAAAEAARAIAADDMSDDAARNAAKDRLQKAIAAVRQQDVLLPQAGVEYALVNGFKDFFNKQNTVKSMDVLQDSILWWDNADTNDAYQRFTFEPKGGDKEHGYAFFMKNVGTGMYVAGYTDYVNNDSTVWGNPLYIRMSSTPDTILLHSVGNGQFKIEAKDTNGEWRKLFLHSAAHNSGNATNNPANPGGRSRSNPNGYGLHGVNGPIVPYNGSVDSQSSWYIRCIDTLPATDDVQGVEVETRAFHLVKGMNFFSLSADKSCNFDDLGLYTLTGEPIPFEAEHISGSVTVSLEANVESFIIRFTNTEGVTKLTVDGNLNRIAELRRAYETALALQLEESTEVGGISDLSAFNAAMTQAESYLATGATDEQIDEAVQAINDAINALTIVMPDPEKKYYIVSAYSEFLRIQGTEMALYYNLFNMLPGWAYVSTDATYEWQFEPVELTVGEGETAQTVTAYYIKSVLPDGYLGPNVDSGSNLTIEASTATAEPYSLLYLGDMQFNIKDFYDTSAKSYLHAGFYNYGNNYFGVLSCYNGYEANGPSAWYIREVKDNDDEGSFVAPVIDDNSHFEDNVIFDLTGRRVINPGKGIYIVNGTKMLIK